MLRSADVHLGKHSIGLSLGNLENYYKVLKYSPISLAIHSLLPYKRILLIQQLMFGNGQGFVLDHLF